MSTLKLNRAALSDAIRASAGWRAVTKDIERKTRRTAVRIADSKVKRRTGAYVGNFETTVTPLAQINTLARLRLFNTRSYAQIIEAGSRPHIIRVRNAKVLYSKDAGLFFGPLVHHPGTQPQHVIREALLLLASGRAL